MQVRKKMISIHKRRVLNQWWLHYIEPNDKVSLIVHFALKLYAFTLNFNTNLSSRKIYDKSECV